MTFSLADGGSCTSPNSVSFACGRGGDVDVDAESSGGIVKLVYQPWESFQYYAGFGVASYTLRVPSTTVTNVLRSGPGGVQVLGGLRAVVMPDTEFTPAVAFDAGGAIAQYAFYERYGAPNQDSRINQDLTLSQAQFAVEASKLIRLTAREKLLMFEDGVKLEPYGGLKWTRMWAKLTDNQSGGAIGGRTDSAQPFIGLHVPVYKSEGFFAEATLVNGYSYAAGMTVRFK